MRSMKTVASRLHKLDVRFAVEGRMVTVPSTEAMIAEKLVAGEWECARKLLELQEQDVLREWRSSRSRDTGPNRRLDIDFTDLTRLRSMLDTSLGELPPELRWRIAEELLAADTKPD